MDGAGDDTFLFKDEAFRIRGAVFHVYRTMGAGFLEGVYHECLAIELGRRGVPFEMQRSLALTYDGVPLQRTYVPDFICYGQIILELKALRAIAPEHRAQTINYLRAANMRLGLLVNFGATPGVQIERFAL
ncbi:GxxExxY protein [Phenylobacterium sp.]|uniref:GxxExxY protein n=1 Tax=Phenylobacterium sp. TaxID=1871053 RepID=UPI0025FAFB54|nr:GxxExxY protein [Phenylobacterium sp.]MBX3486066.1 GxxExxY protein [Phenylobacterium sp.]MCW5761039.1 GxxExxY protein [Phenylobacterium sp.]